MTPEATIDQMTLPDLAEAQRDIGQTKYDVVMLEKVKTAIENLIFQSQVENKTYYNGVLLNVNSNIAQGHSFIAKVEAMINEGKIK